MNETPGWWERVPHLDPARHLLVYPKRARRADGRDVEEPYLIDELVPQWRRALDAGRPDEAALGRPAPGVVSMSANRALVLADLVEELGLRLRPGHAVGPIQSDGSLSRLATELADDLMERQFPTVR
jgi:hypothetical protein